MNSNSFYITTPIYYVNDIPHIGHAYTTCAADILARYHRLLGEKVLFVTGTDEHGQKIEKAAAAQNITPQDLVNRVILRFQELWEKMGISYDDFIRTTESRHIETVKELFITLQKKGDIYKGEYEGWYCIPCETFWPENQLDDRLVCPDCGRALEKLREESYFFALSRYEKTLLNYFESHPEFVMPEARCNEIVSFIKSGLKDQSISRLGLSWGIPVPGDEKHTLYVWFDALINYLTVVDYGKNSEKFDVFWPSVHHLVGKDILRFHSVLWPGMLLAAGLSLPKRIFAHGWWTVEGEKMSKSRGNVVDPYLMIEKYGVDRFRYFIMREVSFGLDGDFSEKNLVERTNSDLSDNFGNLVHRTLNMAWKYFEGKVPKPNDLNEQEWGELVKEVLGKLTYYMDKFAFAQALESIWKLVHYCNRYIEKKAPWVLNKDPDKREELNQVMYCLLDSCRILALVTYPFIPSTAIQLWNQLGFKIPLTSVSLNQEFIWNQRPNLFELEKPIPLFPRIV